VVFANSPRIIGLARRRPCLLDHYDSGLIQLITINETLNFELHDSRLDQYNLNAEI
jgi:hypothetical protein